MEARNHKEAKPEEWKEPYEYDFLLSRVFHDVRTKAEKDLAAAASAEKIKVRKPVFAKKSKKRLAWTNFGDFCAKVGRPPAEVVRFFAHCSPCRAYISRENGYLTIKGQMPESMILFIIQNYINQMVRCQACLGFTTEHKKNERNGSLIVECRTCNASQEIKKQEKPCKLLTTVYKELNQ